MPANKLFLQSKTTKNRFFLAASFGQGWEDPGPWSKQELLNWLRQEDPNGGLGDLTNVEVVSSQHPSAI